jgi:hypothetical protein
MQHQTQPTRTADPAAIDAYLADIEAAELDPQHPTDRARRTEGEVEEAREQAAEVEAARAAIRAGRRPGRPTQRDTPPTREAARTEQTQGERNTDAAADLGRRIAAREVELGRPLEPGELLAMGDAHVREVGIDPQPAPEVDVPRGTPPRGPLTGGGRVW